ncbi:Cobalt-precorrin-4 C(11)-methyltransferase [hydrothermal vent metagenome]|uniref:Cobalt-precorrin-4 C(11)-methyltransferase n=1 Tax=hydrothermal vent metagenome TaxID=652676 RepID=A0A3B1CCD8_9ZZZZ
MKVYFIGGGPGDPELLTLKAKRLIETMRVCIYAGSLLSDAVVSLIPPGAKRYDSAKMNMDEIMEVIVKAKEAGENVARVHSGDPSIYGAIREQMMELCRLGIDYEVVPGVSSFQAAAAALRKELTAPEISQTITLTRLAGRTPVPESQELAKLAETGATLCIFLSVDKIFDVMEKLLPAYGADCPAAVIHRASWPDQKIIEGSIADIAQKVKDAQIKKTAMIIVGWALSEKGDAVSRLYAKEFSHEYRKAEIK